MFTRITCSLFNNKAAVLMSSEAASANNWRGVPLSEMYGSQSPWSAPEFSVVSPGLNHTVLYHIPMSGNLVGDRPPKPQIGKDRWDNDHVRMPCSSHSLYPVVDSNGQSHLKKRWELIEAALWEPIRNTEELASTILSYNTKFKSVWKFRALHKLFNEYLEEEEAQYFFDVTLPQIVKLTLALPKLVQSPIPLLKQHKNQAISLSQEQISSLLANAFFCTFPRRNTSKRTSEYANYPHINFNRLYEMVPTDDVMEKLKCICHYFRRVCTKAPVGVTTFSRRSVVPRKCPNWPASTVQLASLPLHVDPDNTIENADGLIQVDFANKYLGGGVLGHGCVQEEIRFVICPELMISMLFTESLRHNEALMMIGCERYSGYSGYGQTFHWTDNFVDETPFDSSQRRRVAVLAIDALPYTSVQLEYRKDAITREITKAWVGFSFGTDPASTTQNYPGIATGNWGCGAFGGSPQLKSLIQMIACVQAMRPMAYYTFKDNDIRDEVIGVYNLLVKYNVTVGQLYKYIISYSTCDVRNVDLHSFIHQMLKDDEKKIQTQKNIEKMEMSEESPETAKCDLSSTTLKECQDSPDLFSQDETDETVPDVTMYGSTSEGVNDKQTKEPNNSKLFEEMEKLDEQSGRLNLSVRNTSMSKPTAMDTSEPSNPTTEMKKKISRKITDYFSKKTF